MPRTDVGTWVPDQVSPGAAGGCNRHQALECAACQPRRGRAALLPDSGGAPGPAGAGPSRRPCVASHHIAAAFPLPRPTAPSRSARLMWSCPTTATRGKARRSYAPAAPPAGAGTDAAGAGPSAGGAAPGSAGSVACCRSSRRHAAVGSCAAPVPGLCFSSCCPGWGGKRPGNTGAVLPPWTQPACRACRTWKSAEFRGCPDPAPDLWPLKVQVPTAHLCRAWHLHTTGAAIPGQTPLPALWFGCWAL